MCLKTPGSGEVFLPNIWKTLIFQELCLKNLKLLCWYSNTVDQYRSIGVTGAWQRLLFYHSVCTAHFTFIAQLPRAGSIKTPPFKNQSGILVTEWCSNENKQHLLINTRILLYWQNIDITMTVPPQAGLLNSFLWNL